MTKTTRIAYISVFTALIAGVTLMGIPVGIGYVHLGDAVIMLACHMLGYYGAIAGALGASIADLAFGYAIYAPVTLVAKTLLAVIGVWICKRIKGVWGLAIGFTVSGIFMQGAYFLFDFCYLGAYASTLNIFWLIMQTVLSVPVGIALIAVIDRVNKRKPLG